MAGDSRPPLSHLRPTLSTRLRRSFEGKRSKTENGYSGFNGAPDPETLQSAIQQAISSEAFQNAIAANLANIIKPSITTALDTIQPVVEAVYAHDVLLRKTHRNVEDMLEKMDTIPEEDGGMSPNVGGYYDMEFKALLEKSGKRTVATLAELSNAVHTNTSKLVELENSVGQSRENTEYLKSYMQNEMDQLQREMSRISQLMESQRKAHSNTHSLVSAHANRLDVMSSGMADSKAPAELSEKLDAVSGELNLLRASVDAGAGSNSGGFAMIGSKIDDLASELHSHGSVIREIKEADASQDVLAALQRSNDSHASHATILGTIHERSLAPPQSNDSANATEDVLRELQSQFQDLKNHVSGGHATHSETVNGLAAKLDHLLATIEDQHATDPSAEILEALQKANASHDSHTAVLNGLQERALAPATTSQDASEANAVLESIKATLEALKDQITSGQSTNSSEVTAVSGKIDSLISTIEQQKPVDSSADILEALQRSNDSHASHSSALDGLKSLVVVPTPVMDNSGFERVEGHLQTIVETLTAHTTSLGDIKEAYYQRPELDDTLHSGITSIATTLTTQTKLLDEIKEDISAEILTALHDIGQTQALHSTTLSEIRESDVSDEILTALHTSIEAHTGHQTEFVRLHGAVKDLDDKHDRHATNIDEIRTRSLEPAAVATDVSTSDVLEKKISDLVTILEEQKTTLLAIQASTESARDSHAAHAVSLGEIKSRSLEPVSTSPELPGLEELQNKITSIIETLEGHSTALNSIKDSTHAAVDAHASSLDEIKAVASSQKDLHESHASTLSEIKEAQAASRELHNSHSATLADLVIATGSANESHASHAATLAELKSLPPPPTTDLSGLTMLDQDLKAIITTLSHHTTTLAEIDVAAATPHPDILSSLERSHELLKSHTSILESMKLPTGSDTLLEDIEIIKAGVEGLSADVKGNGKAIKDIHSETKDSHSSLATAIASIAAGGAAGAGIGFLTSRGGDDDEKAGNDELLREIKAVRDVVEGGVSLNEKGLEQLKVAGPIVTIREVDEGSVQNDERSILTEVGEVGKEAHINPVIVARQVDHEKLVDSSDVLGENKFVEKELVPSSEQSKDDEVDVQDEITTSKEIPVIEAGSDQILSERDEQPVPLESNDAPTEAVDTTSKLEAKVEPESQDNIADADNITDKTVHEIETVPEQVDSVTDTVQPEAESTHEVVPEPSSLTSAEKADKDVEVVNLEPEIVWDDAEKAILPDSLQEKVVGDEEAAVDDTNSKDVVETDKEIEVKPLLISKDVDADKTGDAFSAPAEAEDDKNPIDDGVEEITMIQPQEDAVSSDVTQDLSSELSASKSASSELPELSQLTKESRDSSTGQVELPTELKMQEDEPLKSDLASTTPIPTEETILDSASIDQIRQQSLTPKDDSDDDMVVEWSGKDHEVDNDASTVFETAVDEPYTSSKGGEKLRGGEGENDKLEFAVPGKFDMIEETSLPVVVEKGNSDDLEGAKEDAKEDALLGEKVVIEDQSGVKESVEEDSDRPLTPVEQVNSTEHSPEHVTSLDREQVDVGDEATLSPVAVSRTTSDKGEEGSNDTAQSYSASEEKSSSHPKDDSEIVASAEEPNEKALPITSDDKPVKSSGDDIDDLITSKLTAGEVLHGETQAEHPQQTVEDVDAEETVNAPASTKTDVLDPVLNDELKAQSKGSLDDVQAVEEVEVSSKVENHEISSKSPLSSIEPVPKDSDDNKSTVALASSTLDALEASPQTTDSAGSGNLVEQTSMTKPASDVNPDEKEMATGLEAAKSVPVPLTPATAIETDDGVVKPANAKKLEDDEADYFTKEKSVKSPTFSLPEETDSEPPTPATPGFNNAAKEEAEPVTPGGTNNGGGGKKGKKGKKAKKGKKEKVPFELEGEDPDQA